jgi:hypothetical protein
MPILQGTCSVGGTGPTALCHGDPSVAMPFAPGENTPGGMRQWFGPPLPAVNSAETLTTIYNAFVGVVSFDDTNMDVVKPGDPTQGFLWYKINGTQGGLDEMEACSRGDYGSCGAAMPLPLAGQTLTLLPQADRGLICNWIVQGALNDSSPCPAGEAFSQNGTCALCPTGQTLCGPLRERADG